MPKRLIVVAFSVIALGLLPCSAWAAAATEPGSATPVHPCDRAPAAARPACRLATDGPSAVVGGIVTAGADAALDAIVAWVVGSAAWLLSRLVELIDSSTRPDVRAGWFAVAYRDMATVGALVMLPLLLVSVIQALVRQSPGHLVRAVGVYVPVAAVGMFAAVAVIDQLVTVTDDLAAFIGSSFGTDLTGFATTVGQALSTDPLTSAGSPGAALPGFASLLGALVIAFASFVIWVLLVLRQAAIYVGVLFLPLGFAALVWPATAHWLRRLAEGLVAVILAKFVIVAVMAMAGGALAAVGQQGFGVVVSGSALLLLAAFAPFVLLRMIPVFEAGLANGLEGVTTSRTSPVPGPSAAGVYRGVRQARAGISGGGFGGMGAGTAGLAATGVATGGAALAAGAVGRAGSAALSAAGSTASTVQNDGPRAPSTESRSSSPTPTDGGAASTTPQQRSTGGEPRQPARTEAPPPTVPSSAPPARPAGDTTPSTSVPPPAAPAGPGVVGPQSRPPAVRPTDPERGERP